MALQALVVPVVVRAQHLKVELGSSASGLPQTNPPLEAKVEDNVLTWITSNAVSNTFRLKITARELGTRSSQK